MSWTPLPVAIAFIGLAVTPGIGPAGAATQVKCPSGQTYDAAKKQCSAKPTAANPDQKPTAAKPVQKPAAASPVRKPVAANPVQKPIAANPVPHLPKRPPVGPPT